jgi:hypothetical protein
MRNVANLNADGFQDNALVVLLEGKPVTRPTLDFWLSDTGVGFNPVSSFRPSQVLVDDLDGWISGGWSVTAQCQGLIT